jgi:hypothetical protein
MIENKNDMTNDFFRHERSNRAISNFPWKNSWDLLGRYNFVGLK